MINGDIASDAVITVWELECANGGMCHPDEAVGEGDDIKGCRGDCRISVPESRCKGDTPSAARHGWSTELATLGMQVEQKGTTETWWKWCEFVKWVKNYNGKKKEKK